MDAHHQKEVRGFYGVVKKYEESTPKELPKKPVRGPICKMCMYDEKN